MPLSTRDYQRDRRNSRLAAEALIAFTEGFELFDTDNTSLNRTPLNNVRSSRHPSNATVANNLISNVEDQTTHKSVSTPKKSLFGHYHWKMSHYFYIHLITYIFNGFFGGLIIFLIENYSSYRNKYMVVTYLDAWFTTVSTICSCGLTTIDFAQLSHASQLVMMSFAFISGFAMSTLPALIIKAQTHKTTQGTNVDDDNEKYDKENDDELEMSNHRSDQNLPPHIRIELLRLPTPLELRYRAYIMCISLILDLGSKDLQQYSPGIRLIIFIFQTVNLRFCGFQSFDISLFATATVLVYLLLMATKPQMLCALDESPFEIYWLTLEAQAEVDAETNNNQRNMSKSLPLMLQRAMSVAPTTTTDASLFKKMKSFLRRQSLLTKELARKEFSKNVDDEKSIPKRSKRIKVLRLRLFLIHFIRALAKHTFDFFILTRTWLFVFIFLICAIEYRRMAPVDPHITLSKIIFEIISAFGGVGMSLGYPNKTTSFASVLSTGSKVILIATMLMGRHRGLLASMKDQEVIEYSAINILVRRREEYILQSQTSRIREITVKGKNNDPTVVHF
ncbi:unnamed protein product [Rotaria sp. Silwood2]|nr:unnamed protein product [Rotaria sp. Silwood2]CAF3035013.1 unnamed protein product [Rotaria sp. Silwood2]CAF4199443.1 unnamed protein product [Rotaria sp. Silwood2]